MATTTEETFYEQAKKYAAAVLEDIREKLAKLEHAQQCDGEEIDGEPREHMNDEEWHDENAAREAIEEDPLSVQVRDGWKAPGAESDGPEEYELLLCTGGPAARIVGRLGQCCQPDSARFEYQDWFKPWTEVILTGEDHDALLEYARQFYFGE